MCGTAVSYESCVRKSLNLSGAEEINKVIKDYTTLIENCEYWQCENKNKICPEKRAFFYHSRGFIYLRYVKGIHGYEDACRDFETALSIFKDSNFDLKERAVGECYLSVSLAKSKLSEISSAENKEQERISACLYAANGIYALLGYEKCFHAENLHDILDNVLFCPSYSNAEDLKEFLKARDTKDFIDILGRSYYEIGKNNDRVNDTGLLEKFRMCLDYSQICFDVIEEIEKKNMQNAERNFCEFSVRILSQQILLLCKMYEFSKIFPNSLQDIRKRLESNITSLIALENSMQKKFQIIPPVFDNKQQKGNLFYNQLIDYREFLYISRTKSGYNDNWVYLAFLKFFMIDDFHFSKELKEQAEWYSFKYFIKFLSSGIKDLIEKTNSILKNGIKFYKFYSLNNDVFNKLMSNLRKSEIYFSSPYFYDDKENELKAYNSLYEKLKQNLRIKKILEELAPFKSREDKSSRSKCSYGVFPCVNITASADNANFYQMWSNYAARYAGICVEYEIQEVINNTFDFDIFSYTEYDYDTITEDFCAALRNVIIMSDIEYISKKDFDNDIESQGTTFNVSGFFKTLFFTKPVDWMSEKEFRIISFFDNKDPSSPLKKISPVSPGGTKCSLIGKTSKIILGYKISSECEMGMENKDELLKRLKEILEKFRSAAKDMFYESSDEDWRDVSQLDSIMLAHKKDVLDKTIKTLLETEYTINLNNDLKEYHNVRKIMDPEDLNDLVTFHKGL